MWVRITSKWCLLMLTLLARRLSHAASVALNFRHI
jgi:hypothetical protein